MWPKILIQLTSNALICLITNLCFDFCWPRIRCFLKPNSGTDFHTPTIRRAWLDPPLIFLLPAEEPPQVQIRKYQTFFFLWWSSHNIANQKSDREASATGCCVLCAAKMEKRQLYRLLSQYFTHFPYLLSCFVGTKHNSDQSSQSAPLIVLCICLSAKITFNHVIVCEISYRGIATVGSWVQRAGLYCSKIGWNCPYVGGLQHF